MMAGNEEYGYPDIHSIDLAKESLDDDGRAKRTGSVWTASAHIITAVIGSGVLSLAWAMAQLGWIAGPAVMILFSFVTYYTSTLLASCYRTGDPVTGKRNYTYMDAVKSNLGGSMVKICGYVQYVNLFGISIGYTIASAISMMAVKRSNCHHKDKNGGPESCQVNANPFIIGFGILEIFLSQIPDFDQLWWLSIVAAVMSFTYSGIGLGLGIAKVAENRAIKGTSTGVSVGTITEMQKLWRSFQALGNIAFAYSYSIILIEIQDTVKSPPSEVKTMKKATAISVTVTSIFYILCGSFGYAAFGDLAPGNLLTGKGFYEPYWLIDIANVAVLVHLVGAYQVFAQPIFAFVEKRALTRYPHSKFITKEIRVNISCSVSNRYSLNLFRLVWRTSFVILTTLISMILPFFNDIVGLLGAVGYWPLAVYFPIEMYIAQNRIHKWSTRWVCLQILSMVCLVAAIAAAVGSIVGVIGDLKSVKPFHANF
ncbi:Amino acid permease 2 [Linum grandiflorum]